MGWACPITCTAKEFKEVNKMDENYTPDILTLSDDEGNEYTVEVLDEYEENSVRYLALSPVYDDPADTLNDSGELVIVKEITEGGEAYFEEICDEEEFDHIASIFTTKLNEIFDIEQ